MNLRIRQTATGRIAKNSLMYAAYCAATTCAVPLVTVGLLASARGRRRLGERFGSWRPVGEVDWWLHGASVGEVQGLLPFIREIRSARGSDKVFLSATSPTGLERASGTVDQARLLPLDTPLLTKRCLAKVRASRFVLSETELWPALITGVLRQGVPCHIINGRISDYTLKTYRAFRGLFAPLLNNFCSISVPDEEQRQRFLSLGIDPESLHVIGHTKYDSSPRLSGEDFRSRAREKFFPGIKNETPIIVLGSLRNGEEQVWFPALKSAWDSGLKFKVIIAPRHAERFDYFWGEVASLGRLAARWSSGIGTQLGDYDVLLLDTFGVLEEAYAGGDLAFVGATLVDIGGHNPFEPAMYRVPVVVGPYSSVIREPVSLMRERGGIIEVQDSSELLALLKRVCAGEPELHRVGQAGYAVFASQRGASGRALEVIRHSEALACD
jgi:3-deoxy-D-manno-octulosonic-acid transferase